MKTYIKIIVKLKLIYTRSYSHKILIKFTSSLSIIQNWKKLIFEKISQTPTPILVKSDEIVLLTISILIYDDLVILKQQLII